MTTQTAGSAESDKIDLQATQTILVIDDDEAIRQVIGVMLENEGFRAVLAADGTTGQAKASA